jgi:putative hydrolase of the HAD superfamily
VIYYDSIPTLDALKKAGFKIAAMTDVATGMPDLMHKNYVTPLLPYFDLYVSSLSCGYKKPNPKGLRDISEQLGIAPENMVMIGDTHRDVNAAKNLGCRSILINRKDSPSQEIGQDFTITNTQEILELIN